MISFVHRKIFKRQNGSLTVEAAIALPIFICAILTIGFFIKLVHTQEIIQYAINETANEMASSSYVFYSTGLYEVEASIYDGLTEKTNNSQQQKEELKKLLDIIKNGTNVETQGSEEEHNYNNLKDALEIIQTLSEALKSNSDGIESLFKLTNEIMEQGIYDNIKDIAVSGQLELYHYLKNQAGNMIMKEQLRKHLIIDDDNDIVKRMQELHIVIPTDSEVLNRPSQLYGLDFSRSSYLYGNDEIDIVVMYKVDLPLPIDFMGEISIVQRATARAWLGGANPSLILEESRTGNQNPTEEEADKESKIVYVTRTGECYHKGTCYHLRKSKIPAKLNEIIEEGIYRACSHCYGD